MEKLQDIEDQLQSYRRVLDEELEKKLGKIRSRGGKQVLNVEKRLGTLHEDALKFQEEINDDSPVNDKYSNRIAEIVNNTVDSLETPKNVTYLGLETYAEKVRKALQDQDADLIKYVRLLKEKKYKGRVRALGTSLKRLNGDLEKLEKFIAAIYAPQASDESSINDIDQSMELLEKYEQQHKDLVNKQDEVLEKDKEIDEIRQQIHAIEIHEDKQRYQGIYDENRELQREIDEDLSHIRKVMKKYENVLGKAKEKRDTTLLKELISDPAGSLGRQGSTGSVSALLRELMEALDNPKLKLNREKREAANRDLNELLEGKLEDMWTRCRQSYGDLAQIRDKLKEHQFEEKLDKLNNLLHATIRDRNRLLERELRLLRDTHAEINKLYSQIVQTLQEYGVNPSEGLMEQIPAIPEWAEVSK